MSIHSLHTLGLRFYDDKIIGTKNCASVSRNSELTLRPMLSIFRQHENDTLQELVLKFAASCLCDDKEFSQFVSTLVVFHKNIFQFARKGLSVRQNA